MPRQLKTQNKGRNTVEVKVTLKPEIAKLLDAATQLKNPELTRSGFLKLCLTKELRLITLYQIDITIPDFIIIY